MPGQGKSFKDGEGLDFDSDSDFDKGINPVIENVRVHSEAVRVHVHDVAGRNRVREPVRERERK